MGSEYSQDFTSESKEVKKMMTAQEMMRRKNQAMHEHNEHERQESRLREMAERVQPSGSFCTQGVVNKILRKK